MTYTPPNKAPEGHKWVTKYGSPAHWTGGYTLAGLAIFETSGFITITQNDGEALVGVVVRDAPKRPLEIPWDAFKDCWVCAAVDRCGSVYLYASRPTKEKYEWRADTQTVVPGIIKYERGDMPWDQSLVWRPGHEPEGEG